MPAPDLTIRRADVNDAAALAAFAARTFEETYAAQNDPAQMREHLAAAYGPGIQRAELADLQAPTLLALAGTQWLGYARLRPNAAPPACVTQLRPMELHRFYVDRPAHGTGTAQRLMAAALEAAAAAGAGHVWLSVWERNPRAIAFYRKCGFVDIGGTEFVLGADRQADRVLLATLA